MRVVNAMMSIDSIYLQRIEALLASGRRVLLGLVGAPGAGKSTLAQALHSRPA